MNRGGDHYIEPKYLFHDSGNGTYYDIDQPNILFKSCQSIFISLQWFSICTSHKYRTANCPRCNFGFLSTISTLNGKYNENNK